MSHKGIDTVVEFVGQPPKGLIERRLQEGFLKFLKEGDTISLHACLGLPRTPGAIRRQFRDTLLRQAAALLGGAGDWEKAGELHEAMRIFKGDKWAVRHRLPNPPSNASPVEALLFRAFKHDENPPRTQQGIWVVLTNKVDRKI